MINIGRFNRAVRTGGAGRAIAPQDFEKHRSKPLSFKEVCNGGVACSLLKLGSLEKTVTASLFHSGLHSCSPFFVEKTTLYDWCECKLGVNPEVWN